MREAGERHGRVAGPSCGLFAVFGGMGGTASPNRTLISPGRPAGGSGAGLEGKGASGSAVWGAKLGPDAAILIMTEFSLFREAPALKPPKATAKPYTRHIRGIDSGLQSHTTATPQPHHSHTTATPQPHHSHTTAIPQPYHSHTKAIPQPHQSQLLRLFQWLEGAETACSPRVLAIMRIAGPDGSPRHGRRLKGQSRGTAWRIYPSGTPSNHSIENSEDSSWDTPGRIASLRRVPEYKPDLRSPGG